MTDTAVQERFQAALDALVEQIKKDKAILAAILCGSLAHDVVWEKSDIDLMLITVDDKRVETSDLPLFADGINVHANLIPRTVFRQTVEGAVHQSFIHSLLAKGKLLYTHDDTIAELFARLSNIGARDSEVQLLRAGMGAVPCLYKARKWFVTRGDLDYTALWILWAAHSIADIELIARRQLVDRESLPRALSLNPELFGIIYSGLLNTPKTRELVQRALDTLDQYLSERAETLFAPIISHLREVGEVRSSREIEDHFKRHLNVTGVTMACEYLSDLGLIGKASAPVRLTKKSSVDVQELAFFWMARPQASRST